MSVATSDFVKPKKLETDKKHHTNTYGKFVAEPFERGFATTIGNSVRRHLLASIEGSAVSFVKFENVFHEFSTIPGVIEDMANIILNIKELRFKLHTRGPKTVFIKAKGKGVLTGKDIITDADIEVVNPDCHIATMDRNGTLNAELTVEKGRGYVPAEGHTQDEKDVQMIPIDSCYSPIRKVNFDVENTRVGTSTEFERLIIEVWTDGSIKPEDAIAHSAKIMKDHLQIFINFDEEEEVKAPIVDEERQKTLANLKKSVDELELSVRSFNCLKNADIRTIVDLVVKTDGEMLKTQNFGRKSLNEIKEILNNMGLSLGVNIDEYREDLIKDGVLEK